MTLPTFPQVYLDANQILRHPMPANYGNVAHPQDQNQHFGYGSSHSSDTKSNPDEPAFRSSSEATNDTSNKFRQLPCRTFISVGTCPYRERCVYLHDPRLICREARTKTRRKNKEDVVLDAFFWPVMQFSSVAQKLDNSRQPHVVQSYHVPASHDDQYEGHDSAVYSLWMHFVTFCQLNEEIPNESHPFHNAMASHNMHSKAPRLSVFRSLSSGPTVPIPTSNEQLASKAVAVHMDMQPMYQSQTAFQSMNSFGAKTGNYSSMRASPAQVKKANFNQSRLQNGLDAQRFTRYDMGPYASPNKYVYTN